MNRRVRILAALMLAAAPIGGCMAAAPSCYTKRASVVLPDRTRVLAHLTNGASGRAVAEAIFDGRVGDAHAMLARDPRLITTAVIDDPKIPQPPAGQYGDLLTFAVARCDADATTMLFAAGMPKDGVKRGNALSLAILADSPTMAEQLLTAGASPDPQAGGGESPMRSAISFGHLGGVMTLLRHGADPRWTDRFGIDPVRMAMDAEQAEIAELLVQKGGTLWSVADDGSMAAHALLEQPVIFTSPEMLAARARLVERARAAGLGWPPPDRATVKQKVASGAWPTAAMAKAGMTVAPAVLERMRATQR
ncbi:ankyrin repeat domain-containing protein [Sphingomonas sp. NFR04]|uniref:ankyrin repeat domain-containing protein n=1 Tax=Sphingomonas sp. NFR04 TaxID=1566283 RepID=UPI000B85B1F7|nr:ankyrin repeat domain-containing protein [Sphingomonas sp. NFR04]